jgi:hypothetical protein
MPTGYSGTLLTKKLGITEGTKVVAIAQPANYAKLVAPLPAGATIVGRAPTRPRFVHLFATKRTDLVKHLAVIRKRIEQDGVLWVSWPKRTSKVETNITEDVIRAEALPLGFVDVKVCAVDETWSGLKLVLRKENRR